nr:MAG TPA: hypothetical protein [Inoviridae sp.]
MLRVYTKSAYLSRELLLSGSLRHRKVVEG